MTENETMRWLVAYMLRFGKFSKFDFYCIIDTLEDLPIDLSEYNLTSKCVRCKDCRWSQDAPKVEEYHLECILRPLSRHYTGDEDFCSQGEPK